MNKNFPSKPNVLLRRSFIATAIIFPVASMVHFPVKAMEVFDITNYTQNLIQAAQATAMEVRQVLMLKQQIESNVRGLIPSELVNIAGQLRDLQEIYQSAMSLKSVLGEGLQAVTNIQALFGASNFKNWGEFASSLAKRKEAGDSVAKNLFKSAENADKAIKSSYEAHQRIAEKLTSVRGITEALQATSATVGVVIQQNQAMMATLSARVKQKAFEQSVEDAEERAIEKSRQDYFLRSNAAAQRVLEATRRAISN